MGRNRNKIVNPRIANAVIYLARKLYFERVFDIEVELNETIGLKPPYLVLANHTNTWDPGLINLYIEHPISFVTADVWFIKPFWGRMLKYVGAIPKTKNKSDYLTIKKIIEAKNENRVVGIFPEGKRSWDGVTLDLYYSTSKLVKMLGIPVVCVLIKGGCLALPRWSDKNRHGKIMLSYKLALNPEQISKMSVDDIHQSLTNQLHHDEYEWQDDHKFTYSGENLAESLEYFLFACPNCKTIGSLSSEDDKFLCKSCNYSVTYNDKGYFTSDNSGVLFNTTRKWNLWQQSFLDKLIFKSQKNELIMKDRDAIYHIGKQGEKIVEYLRGEIAATDQEFIFKSNDGQSVRFPIFDILGLNVKWNNQFEFYSNDMLHRFSFREKVSAYKWVQLLSRLSELLAGSSNIMPNKSTS